MFHIKDTLLVRGSLPVKSCSPKSTSATPRPSVPGSHAATSASTCGSHSRTSSGRPETSTTTHGMRAHTLRTAARPASYSCSTVSSPNRSAVKFAVAAAAGGWILGELDGAAQRGGVVLDALQDGADEAGHAPERVGVLKEAQALLERQDAAHGVVDARLRHAPRAHERHRFDESGGIGGEVAQTDRGGNKWSSTFASHCPASLVRLLLLLQQHLTAGHGRENFARAPKLTITLATPRATASRCTRRSSSSEMRASPSSRPPHVPPSAMKCLAVAATRMEPFRAPAGSLSPDDALSGLACPRCTRRSSSSEMRASPSSRPPHVPPSAMKCLAVAATRMEPFRAPAGSLSPDDALSEYGEARVINVSNKADVIQDGWTTDVTRAHAYTCSSSSSGGGGGGGTSRNDARKPAHPPPQPHQKLATGQAAGPQAPEQQASTPAGNRSTMSAQSPGALPASGAAPPPLRTGRQAGGRTGGHETRVRALPCCCCHAALLLPCCHAAVLLLQVLCSTGGEGG
eukprot:jgi/Mesen1/4485/ME000228S03445